MIDLHTHTNYSDGTWGLEELLKNAEKNGINLLSITDHDCVNAHIELKKIDYKKYFSGKIIIGAEFNCIFNNAKIELLGYNFDVEKINDWIKEVYKKNDEASNLINEFNILMKACHKNKVKVDDIEYNETMGRPLDYIFESIKKFPENKKIFSEKELNDREYFFRCCTCNVNFPLYIDYSYQMPDAKIVSEAIRKCGGKVFLAHLFTYPFNDYESFLNNLVENNIIDGIEVYYSSFNEKQIEFLKNYCSKNNLFMSAGTDCHGDKKAERKIGIGYGNMNVSIDVVSDWI